MGRRQRGGRVRSLGLPVIRRPYVGVSVGGSPYQADMTAQLRFGSYRDREAWGRLVSGSAMALGMSEYLKERERQLREGIGVEEEVMAAALQRVAAGAINPLLDTLPLGERPRWTFFLMVGSANENYRSMLMDGEAMVLVSCWTSLYAVPDLILLSGMATWIDDQAELDRRLPRPGGLARFAGRVFRMGL